MLEDAYLIFETRGYDSLVQNACCILDYLRENNFDQYISTIEEIIKYDDEKRKKFGELNFELFETEYEIIKKWEQRK